MKFRTGLAIGLGVGYVLGAKAGRGRYEQIMAGWERVARDERVQQMTSKGKAVVDLAAARARTAVSEGLDDAAEKLRDVVDGAV